MASIASAPFLAMSTAKPRRRSTVKSRVRMASSSSTTRIRLRVSIAAQTIEQSPSRSSRAHAEGISVLRAHRRARLRRRDELHHLAVERRQIVRLAAAHPRAVADAFLVLPRRAGVAQIVLQRPPAPHRAAAHESGGDEQPPPVAGDGGRLAGAAHLLHELLRLLLDAQRVGVDDAAGQHDGVEVGGVSLRQRQIALELVHLVVVLESLHLVLRRDQHARRPGVLESLTRTRHLNLLEAIGDENRNTFPFELVCHEHTSTHGSARCEHSAITRAAARRRTRYLTSRRMCANSSVPERPRSSKRAISAAPSDAPSAVIRRSARSLFSGVREEMASATSVTS